MSGPLNSILALHGSKILVMNRIFNCKAFKLPKTWFHLLHVLYIKFPAEIETVLLVGCKCLTIKTIQINEIIELARSSSWSWLKTMGKFVWLIRSSHVFPLKKKWNTCARFSLIDSRRTIHKLIAVPNSFCEWLGEIDVPIKFWIAD